MWGNGGKGEGHLGRHAKQSTIWFLGSDFSDHHRPSAQHKHLHGPDYDDYSWVMNHDTDSPHNNNDNGGCDDYDDYDDYDNYADDKADDDANDYEKRQRW